MNSKRRVAAFSEKEREDIYLSLSMRANWIETGNPVLSREDLVHRGESKKIKILDHDQVKCVERLRKLAKGFLETDI